MKIRNCELKIRNGKGFTLIELLVVIAVIGMLASIALVSFSGTRDKAKRAQAEQFSSSIYNALGADAVGIWDFNGNANDSSGYGNNGTLVGSLGSLPVLVNDRNGAPSAAYDFDGVDDYIAVGTSSALAPSRITVSFWAKSDVAPVVNDGLLGKTNGNNWTEGWGFFYGSANEIRFFIQHYTNNVVSASVVATEWHHVVGTWDGDGSPVRLYVNGVFRGLDSTAPGVSMTNGISVNPFEIGRLGISNTYNMNGIIDDVRIYSQSFSAFEVQQLYVQGLMRHPFALLSE